MSLRARSVVLTENAAAQFDSLLSSNAPSARSVVNRIRGLRAALLVDALHGEVVPAQRIPAALLSRHGAENLYVEDLPSFWRMLYTIVRNGREIQVVVLEIVDHREYDRWFPGRGR